MFELDLRTLQSVCFNALRATKFYSCYNVVGYFNYPLIPGHFDTIRIVHERNCE